MEFIFQSNPSLNPWIDLKISKVTVPQRESHTLTKKKFPPKPSPNRVKIPPPKRLQTLITPQNLSLAQHPISRLKNFNPKRITPLQPPPHPFKQKRKVKILKSRTPKPPSALGLHTLFHLTQAIFLQDSSLPPSP